MIKLDIRIVFLILCIAPSFLFCKRHVQYPILKLKAHEFYFMRHAQTDINTGKITNLKLNVPINDTGIQQALDAKNFIATLPIKTICFSPLKRAIQTKKLIAPSPADIHQIQIEQLAEIRTKNFVPILMIQTQPFDTVLTVIQRFIQRAAHGLNKTLTYQAPILIVSHECVFMAFCYLLHIPYQEWHIKNCQIMHFFQDSSQTWHVESIYPKSF